MSLVVHCKRLYVDVHPGITGWARLSIITVGVAMYMQERMGWEALTHLFPSGWAISTLSCVQLKRYASKLSTFLAAYQASGR